MNRASEWRELVEQTLPHAQGEVWRFSDSTAALPQQGFKLHLSATVLSAAELLRAVAPLLRDEAFKAPATLELIRQLNCGLFYGVSQIGKIITVYPRTPQRALELAEQLDDVTRGLAAPLVPYDLRFRSSRVVSYRWGAFTMTDGDSVVTRPDGVTEPDERSAGRAVPSWVVDPLACTTPSPTSRLRLLKAFEALAQRGKGGVYRVLDLECLPARLCVMKEGRRHGETEPDGTDGWTRVCREEATLRRLRDAGAPVPRVWSAFDEADARYLLLEDLGERTLHSLIEEAREWSSLRRLAAAHRLLPRLARALASVHMIGLAWRDLKPHNIVLRDEEPWLIDFEGACSQSEVGVEWGSPGYVPRDAASDWQAADVFALGVSLAQLAAGSLEPPDERVAPSSLRPLLSVNASLRPRARALVERHFGGS